MPDGFQRPRVHEGGRRAVAERASARRRYLTISRSKGSKLTTVDVAHSGGHQAKRLSRRDSCQNQSMDCKDSMCIQPTPCGARRTYSTFGEAFEGFNGYPDPTIFEYGSILSNDALVEEFSKYVRLRVPLSAGPVLDCIGGTLTM